jgi:hypothetical protein
LEAFLDTGNRFSALATAKSSRRLSACATAQSPIGDCDERDNATVGIP